MILDSKMSVWRRSDSGAIKRTGDPVSCPLPSKIQRVSSESEPKTIQSLPVEMMQEIFSYLGHNDLMQARQVCTNWSSAIMTQQFIRKFVFNVKRTPDSYHVFHNSTIPWKHAIIRQCHTSRHPNWTFPSYMNTTLMSLTISKCSLNLNWLQTITQQFESMEELTIHKCFLELTSSSNMWERTEEGLNEAINSIDSRRDPVSELMIFPTKLTPLPRKKPLTLKLEMNSYEATNLLLKEFRNNDSLPFHLTTIKLQLPPPNSEEGIPQNRLCTCEKMKSLIEFTKIIAFCKEARSVGVIAFLVIGELYLDYHSVSDEDKAKLNQMYQEAFSKLTTGEEEEEDENDNE